MANQKLTKGSVLSGEAYYASVHRPRITEYKPDGEYVINVVLDKENKEFRKGWYDIPKRSTDSS